MEDRVPPGPRLSRTRLAEDLVTENCMKCMLFYYYIHKHVNSLLLSCTPPLAQTQRWKCKNQSVLESYWRLDSVSLYTALATFLENMRRNYASDFICWYYTKFIISPIIIPHINFLSLS